MHYAYLLSKITDSGNSNILHSYICTHSSVCMRGNSMLPIHTPQPCCALSEHLTCSFSFSFHPKTRW